MNYLPVPESFLDDCFAVLGRRGTGKSNIRQVIFEHMLDLGRRTILIDIKGDSWGIRLNPDGTPAYEIPIIGGEHADIPLDVDQGKDLADMLARHDISCVIDLSLMHQEDQRRFMLPFAKQLLFVNRAPLMLLLEEADVLAPQISGQGGPTTLINAMHSLVKIGRQRGIVMGMFTQRPQSLNKNLISQIETLLALRVTSPRDRAAYKDWFSAHSDEATNRVMKEAPSLDQGEAFCWIAGENYFDRVRWPLCRTFDSGRTPKFDDPVPMASVKLPPLDVEALRVIFNGLSQEHPGTADVEVSDAIVKLKAEFDRERKALNAKISQLQEWCDQTQDYEQKAALWDAVTAVMAFPSVQPPVAEQPEIEASKPDPVDIPSSAGRDTEATTSTVPAGPLGKSTLAVLAALVDAPHLTDGPTESQWAFMAGIDRKSSTWRAHKAKLRPYFNDSNGRYKINPCGIQLLAVHSIQPSPISRETVLQMWISKLPRGSGECLRIISNRDQISRGMLAGLVETDPTTSTFRAYLAPLNKLGLIKKVGANLLSLSDELANLK